MSVNLMCMLDKSGKQLELDVGIMPQDWMMNLRVRAKLISARARADSCIHFLTTAQVLQ